MALPLEFVNVIVRKPAVERCFPGGLDGFAPQGLANLAEDDHILRVGFMSGAEALGLVSELEAAGLRYFGLGVDSDIAVVVGSEGSAPPWLSVGLLDGHPTCWASDHPAGGIVWPEPGFLLRCPRSVYDSLADMARQCRAKVHEDATEVDPSVLAKMRCVRDDAEIEIEAFGEREGNSSVGLWGHRQLARRKQFHADVALIRDLVAALRRAGAEDP